MNLDFIGVDKGLIIEFMMFPVSRGMLDSDFI